MRYLAVMLAVMLLSVAPVVAQTETPANPGIVRELSESAERFGAMTVANLGVIVLLVIAAWRGLAPLLSHLKTVTEDRARLQDELFKRLEAGDKERARTAELMERTAKILGDLETKTETQSGRQSAVDAIAKHVDDDGDKTRKLLKPIEKKLDDVLSILLDKDGSRTAREDELKQKLNAATQALSQLRTQVGIQLNETGEVTPLPGPSETPEVKPSETKAEGDATPTP